MEQELLKQDSVRVSILPNYKVNIREESLFRLWTKFGKLYEEWKLKKITARDFM